MSLNLVSFCVLFGMLFPVFVVSLVWYIYASDWLNNLVMGFHALLSLNPSSLWMLSGCRFISIASEKSVCAARYFGKYRGLLELDPVALFNAVLPLQTCLPDIHINAGDVLYLSTCLSYVHFESSSLKSSSTGLSI